MAGFIQKTLITLSLAHIFLAKAASIPDYENLRERMTTSKFEVVELKSIRINKRSISSPVIRYTFTAHGREVELTLHPTNEDMASGQTPIWQLHNYGNKGTNVSSVKFNKVSKNLLNGIGQIWEDPEKHAAVLIRSTPSRQKFMRGYVASENFIIEVLESVDSFENQRSNRNNTTTNSIPLPSKPSILVTVYQTPQHFNENRLRYTHDEILNSKVRKSYSEDSQIPGLPDTVYPEILVVVDYLTYKNAGQNMRTLLEYLLPFWYSVDMLYRVLESPKVRLHIAAIVIAIEDDILPFVFQNGVHTRILEGQTLEGFGKLLKGSMKYNFPFNSYDIAVAMTPRLLCNDVTRCTGLGIAFVGQTCVARIFPEATPSIAIVTDEGLFTGVITAAHELAHSMGVNHDGYKPSRTDCIDRKRYVMTNTAIDHFGDWSQCSKEDFKHFFESGNANCLLNIPPHRQIRERATIQSILTFGRVILDNMCFERDGKMSCSNKVSKNCQLLQCRKYGSMPSSCYNISTPLKDGAICDVEKICRRGHCVDIL